jgi:hypothetical protein
MTFLEEAWDFTKWVWGVAAIMVIAVGLPVAIIFGVVALIRGCING